LKKFKLPSIADIKEYLTQHPVWLGLLKYSKENSFIGFHGVPIYDVIVFVYHETLRDDLFTRANSVAFSFFLSLFPSLLTIFTLVPFALNALEVWYPGLKNFQSTLDEEISQVMPGQAGEFVLAFVQEITNSPRLGLLSFGFLLAVYFSSNGMLALMQASTIKKFSYFSPGVTLATVLSLATSVAFSFYIDGFDRYDTYIKFYGSIATIIIVMLWLQLNALILIIGFELNAAIAVRRDLTLVEEE